jgi:hypothetical protein
MATTNLMNDMLDIVGTYSCMSQFSEMKGFYSNSVNLNATQNVFNIYGALPPRNREASHTFFGGWTDYCDWDKGIYKFYIMCKILSIYPAPEETQANCNVFKSYADNLEASKTAADKAYVIDQDKSKLEITQSAISDIQSYYRGKYGKLNCDTYLSELEKQKVVASQEAAKQFDFNLVKQSSTATNATTNIVSYVLIGALALIAMAGVYAVTKKD